MAMILKQLPNMLLEMNILNLLTTRIRFCKHAQHVAIL